MTMTKYLVCKTSFEYNDEIYDSSRYGNTSVEPLKCYSSKEKAESIALEKNAQYILGKDYIEPYQTGYSVDEIFDYGFQALHFKFTGKELDFDDYEWRLDYLTLAQAKELVPFLRTPMYQVIPVEEG